MRDRTFMTLVGLLPKSALSTAVGRATRAKVPKPVHQLVIRAFAKSFSVDTDEAEKPLGSFETFGDFFTRKLKPGARPIDPGEKILVSPVDGAISQFGQMQHGQCIQAKGIEFPVERLLDDAEEAKSFEGGSFATLYLSPKDYHRIHAPLDGEIEGYTYLPGEFWPVNRASVASKRALFCVNERLVTYFSTRAGRMAMVAVGATCVARIHASYDQIVTHQGEPRTTRRYPSPIAVKKGDEVGMFEMGSTVILLFQSGKIRWDASLSPESVVRLGKRLGELS